MGRLASVLIRSQLDSDCQKARAKATAASVSGVHWCCWIWESLPYSPFSIVVTSSQLGHGKVASSGALPSLGVILTSFIPWPQDAQGRIFSESSCAGMVQD